MSSRATLSWRSALQKRRYSGGMDLVEQRLTGVAAACPGELGAACRSTLAAGGKRIRPLLTLICARRDVPLGENVLRGATAVELLHMATLVHDDVLDKAELRRGRPTVAAEYGVPTAVSAGNFLLARAFREVVGSGDAAAVDLLSAAAEGLSRGEVLQREAAHRVNVTQGEYERRCQGKTADLFAAACRLGAMLSCMGEPAAGRLAEYGRLIGLAFQVFDDILDLDGDQVATGKRPGTDVRDGTITLPLIFALEAEPGLAPLLSRPEPGDDDVATVIQAVAASGALERARAVALRYIEGAREVLGTCPDLVERDLLVQVAAQVVDRYT
jgi:geranylgeranyl pyrophosphate synthase